MNKKAVARAKEKTGARCGNADEKAGKLAGEKGVNWHRWFGIRIKPSV